MYSPLKKIQTHLNLNISKYVKYNVFVIIFSKKVNAKFLLYVCGHENHLSHLAEELHPCKISGWLTDGFCKALELAQGGSVTNRVSPCFFQAYFQGKSISHNVYLSVCLLAAPLEMG